VEKTVSVTTINGALVNGHYQYAFNSGALGLVALSFILPNNAQVGTATVNSTATDPICGTEQSTTSYQVQSWGWHGSKASTVTTNTRNVSFVLPATFSRVAHVSTSKTAPAYVTVTNKGGKIVRTITFTFHAPHTNHK